MPLPLPYPPASTSRGEGLLGGLLEGSCGRRKRRTMPNRLNVGIRPRITAVVSKYENVIIFLAPKSMVWPRGETGAAGLALCYTSNAKGLRAPERKGCLTPVELN